MKLKIMNLKSKLFAGAVTVAMVLGVAIPASAQTTAELTAQINSLLAMIAQLQAQLSAQGGSTTSGASVVFTKDLTIGSTGSEVTGLQQFLVSKGYLVMPAGVSMGYFGNLTKSSLAKYQADHGISPAAGYFGPITRSSINSMAVTPPTTVPPTTTPGSTGITTPGVEGIMTVTNANAGLVTTAYEGDSMDAILGFKVKAQYSDISIQRVKLNLGNSTKVYNAFYKKLYVTDESGSVLASVDLNSSTVVKEGSTYYVTITGFNYVVPKDVTKQMYVKADLYSSIDSADITSNSPQTVTLADNGVRGVDGAGIDQYSPTTGSDVTKAVTIAASLSDSATLKVSLNSSSPKKTDIVAHDGASNNELDKATGVVFDVKAEKDNVKITDMVIGVVMSNETNGADASTTVYLYDGSTALDSAAVTNGYASFTDLDYVVPKDTTKTLTAKVDIRNATPTRSALTMTASSTGMTAENSTGDTLSTSYKSGTATGYTLGFTSIGPELTLISKSITTDGVPQGAGSNTNSTSSLSATFNVKVKAVGANLYLGTSQATTSPLVSSTTGFGIYRNGAAVTSISSEATSTSFTIGSPCTTNGTNTCVLSDGNEVTVPITFSIKGRSSETGALTSGLYSIDLAAINWNGNSTSFMSGETDWRTADVSFP